MALQTPRRTEARGYGAVTVATQERRDRTRWWVVFAIFMSFVLVVAVITTRTAPEMFSIPLTVLVLSSVACFVRPTIGLYLIVFLTLVGDQATQPWWPFPKNLSSRESIFFVADSLSINPLEILLFVTFASWFLERLADPTWAFVRGRLFVPILVFSGIMLAGFMYGIATGGDRRIAIFEYRPLLYLPLVYILVTNLLTTRMQYRRLFMIAMVAVTIQSLFALSFYLGLTELERTELESLAEFTSTIHMGALFIYFVGALLLRCRAELRWSLGFLAIPAIIAFFVSERRSAMVALAVGFVMLSIILFYRRRRMFWFFVPATTVLTTGFVVATWNAEGPLGLASTAVKSVFFPGNLDAKDQSSDLYRRIEAYDIWFTIRAEPVTGVGFGKIFYKPATLPDISFFEFWEYIPHNAVLWIALKAGIFALVAMFFFFARTIRWGVQGALTVKSDNDAALVTAATAYVAMFLVFAFVNIAWDLRSTVFLGVCAAFCADFATHTESRDPAAARKARRRPKFSMTGSS